MHARRARHRFVDDFGNAARRLLHRHRQRSADRIGHRLKRPCGIERDLAAGEARQIDAAEHDIGVGHRRLRAAACVAGRTRIGAGTVRSHCDAAQRIHARDRTAAGTDLHHIDHRNAHGEATAFGESIGTSDFEMPRLLRREVVDQRELRRRSSHVERDRAVVAAARRDMARQDRAASRSALHQTHRKSARGLHRADASGGHHQQQRTVRADTMQSVLHAREIAIHHRQHVGVRHHRRGSLVLADLAADLRRNGDRHIRQLTRDQVPRPFLMHGIDIGVQETDRHRLDALLAQRRNQAIQRCITERQQHGAIGSQALGHLQPQIARNQGRRPLHIKVVLFETVFIGDLQRIAEAGSGDQRAPRPLAFDQRIGGKRGAMDHQIERGRANTGLMQDRLRSRDHCLIRRGVRRQQLGG